MTKLPDGLYDLLVTQAIEHELAELGHGRRADTEPLEPADSYLLLGRHIAGVIRNALRGIPEEDRVQRQGQISNEILQALATSLPQQLPSGDFVAEPAAAPRDQLSDRRTEVPPARGARDCPRPERPAGQRVRRAANRGQCWRRRSSRPTASI
jgi:hypothetical protein